MLWNIITDSFEFIYKNEIYRYMCNSILIKLHTYLVLTFIDIYISKIVLFKNRNTY